jgi:mannosyltransferase OCH1-like enzyme
MWHSGKVPTAMMWKKYFSSNRNQQISQTLKNLSSLKLDPVVTARQFAALLTVYKSVSDLTINLPNPESKIPRILHQTYKSTLIPNAYRDYVTGCLSKNDGWQYYLWQDSDLETFVRDRYPFMWNKIEKFHTRLQKSDVLRYMILHYYGGIYIDMDVECVKPFFPSLAGHSAFIDQERREHSSILYGMEYSAMNSAMGTIKGHPFFAETIKELLNVSHDGKDVLGTTGPHMLTRVYKRWMTMSLASQFPVTLLRPEIFSPMVDSALNDFRAICRKRDKSE